MTGPVQSTLPVEPKDPLAKLRCTVLVEAETGKPELHWFNGDEGAAQREAEAFCKANPGKRAWVMVATSASPCSAEIKTSWKGA